MGVAVEFGVGGPQWSSATAQGVAAGDAPTLQICLLGGLRVTRDGHELALPASKKTRALLGYLIVTGEPHRRERLCDLFWDGPDDPRGELRWSVSKLRPFVNAPAATRLVTDREHVGFEPLGAVIDLASIRDVIGSDVRFSAASTPSLQAAAVLFRGELLDGLDLPLCYGYQEWCLTERERANRQRRALLANLVERLHDQPEDALAYARALTVADPLAESGHAAVIQLLGRLGRKREAQAHYEHARRLLETELGAPPTDDLAAAHRGLRSPAISYPAGPSALPPVSPPPIGDRAEAPAASTVGRGPERALIDRIVTNAITRQPAPIVLVTGEPGIGKSHLLAYLAERITAGGGAAFGGRAYEAEAARPYGIWIDLLRAIVGRGSNAGLPRDLGLLLPELGSLPGATGDQSRLFDAVVDLLRPLVGEQPIVLTFDDIQWLDEASCALFHYVARQSPAPCGLLLAGAARAGEIDDNAAVTNVMRSLSRDGRLREIALTPLSEAETSTLARTVAPTVDPARIFGESGGNPLFTLELARAHDRGDGEASRTIALVIGGQVSRLRDRGRELLIWAAALDRSFRLDGLARVSKFDPAELLVGLEELERHGLIRPAGADAYEFRHDLIRQVVYRSVSQPRRTFIHRQIARTLVAAAGADAALASDAAHHAALGNDHEVAARACALAGTHALKLFAKAEARGFAERGARHLARLPRGPVNVGLRITLLEIRVLAATGPGAHPLPPLANEVVEAVAAAEAHGLHAAAATGHYLLSVLYQEGGDRPRAEESTLRAAQAGRTTNQATQAHQLANTARCLIELETQVSRARRLVDEADALAAMHNLELCELHWATGLLQRWDGKPLAAIPAIERALSLARHTEDRRREYKCLTWLAILAFEQGRPATAEARCAELIVAAERLGATEMPFAVTLQALAAPSGVRTGAISLNEALRQLRAVDDKSYLAYALNAAAMLAWQSGDAAAAGDYGREALATSTIMRRQNEMAIARALLARLGDAGSAQEIQELRQRISDPDILSARARVAVLAAADTARGIPTRASTMFEQT